MVYICALLLRVALVSLWGLVVVKPLKWLLRQRRMESWRDEHGGPPDEVLEEFHDDDKETPVFQGKLTYSGIAVLALGWALERFGVPVVAGELEAWVAALVAVVGGGAALYGRYRATKG